MASDDHLAALLDRLRVRTRLFHTGPLCGVTTFAAQPGQGFLHVLRRGMMEISHQVPGGGVTRLAVDRPSMVFYPRPLQHALHNAPTDESDFACATVDFGDGPAHPLIRMLPPVVVLPLGEVASLGPALELLFAEIDNVRCGRRALADRLFEVVLIQLLRWILDHGVELDLLPGLLSGLSDERLAGALMAIHDAPGRRWTLATLAREAHMSRSAFASRFHAVVGQPPADYLTEWRLIVAQHRLRAGASVTETATELGYLNVSAFSRVFAQRLGCSPRAWLAAAP